MRKNIFLIFMFGAMIAWGASWSSIKIMNEYLPTAELVFVRYAITALSSFFIVIILRQRFAIDRQSLLIAFLVALLTAVYGYVVFMGTQLGSASLAGAFINAFSPINTFILLALFYKHAIQKLDICALCLGFLGTMMMLGVWQFNAQKIFTAYNLYFVLGAFLWSLITIASSHIKVNVVVFSFYMYSLTAVMVLAFTDLNVIISSNTDMRFWLNTLFVSVISTSIATTLFFLGTKKLGAEKVSSFMFIAPASAVIVGALALGERLNLFTLIGIAASILAVYMLNRIWIFKSHK
ncbi:MAG: DMT family transporter [Campylobacteraceae bacterium]|nr:DMT family transporter [Campylobacteraceae bacterium]